MDDTFDRLLRIQSYDVAQLKELAQSLSEEERELSRRRRILHGQIDIVRAELVRRLRDKHGAGKDVVADDYLTTLADILSGRSRAAIEEELAAEAETADAGGAIPAAADLEERGRPVQERFYDLSANVRDERLIRYVIKQLGQGHRLDDVLNDGYMLGHTSEAKRAELMQNPQIIRAVQEGIKRHFDQAGPGSRPTEEMPESE